MASKRSRSNKHKPPAVRRPRGIQTVRDDTFACPIDANERDRGRTFLITASEGNAEPIRCPGGIQQLSMYDRRDTDPVGIRRENSTLHEHIDASEGEPAPVR
jgi:hypothetical protein